MRGSQRRGPSTAVPLGRGGPDRFVPWMLAPMVYLAMVALCAALAATAVAQRWDAGLRGALTVQIPPAEAAAGPAPAVDAVLAVLQDWPGVSSATPLDQAETGRLLEPWLGEALPLDALPLPTLIDVRVADGAVDTGAMAAAVAAAAPGAVLDDNGRWRQDVRALTTAIRLIAVTMVALVAVAAVAAVVFVTRAGLAIHRPVIDLLHLIGATDAYVAAQFQRHAFNLAARGALIGTVLTLASLAALLWALADLEEVLPLLPSFGTVGWIAVGLVPIAVAMLAMVTARITVLRTLARLP